LHTLNSEILQRTGINSGRNATASVFS